MCSGNVVDLVLKTDENYYPQVFLKECEYIEKEKKVIKFITDDLEISSDDFWQRLDLKK